MRKAALCTGFQTNHLDHLGPLAHTLNVPLITDEKRSLELMNTFYPDVETIYKSPNELTIAYLSANFDALIISTRHYKNEMGPIFALHGKDMTFIQSPHGNSDKEAITQYDGHSHAIIYGAQMRKMLLKRNIVIENIEEVGNYRLSYYCKNKEHLDNLTKQAITFTKKQRTILYAPTWQDAELSSSLDAFGGSILNSLPDHYNLIFKFHPLSIERQLALSTQLIQKYSNKTNVCFLTHFPPIYPLFDLVDIYVGDFSSIGYDFLWTRRPMFFINHDNRNEGTFLHSCGMTIPQNSNIFKFIDTTYKQCNAPYHQKRKEIYDYAFGSTNM